MKLVRPLSMVLVLAAVGGGTLLAQGPDESRDGGRREKVKEPKLVMKLSDKLKFMAGCWEGRLDDETSVEEIWNNPTENLMTATTRYLRKNRATSFEFSKITANDSVVTFSASSEGRPFDEYTMVQIVDEYVVFENLKKTFPQRISYRLASDGALLPRNEGEGQNSIEVRLKKVKCPGT
ncbi:MAG: DUF6265 family protein [Gemmatimonadales bacterium]